MNFVENYLREVREIAGQVNLDAIERLAQQLVAVRRRGGRLFVLGVGGGAANASHAVNDFRKIAGLECYAPTDNVAELTARTNDESWGVVFASWLETSRLNDKDALFILSVGGGDMAKNISPNLVLAVDLARARGAAVLGIVGRDGGHTARLGTAVVIVPTVNPATITSHTESFQAVIWHLLVSHPDLKRTETKWESSVGG
jgi:D-sedoheptulose 7-phosphate isomerase